LTPAEALATATIAPARNVKIDKRTGSIAVGKEADLVLVDGDPSKRIGDLRHVDQVMSDGFLMDGDALRTEAGFSGRPKWAYRFFSSSRISASSSTSLGPAAASSRLRIILLAQRTIRKMMKARMRK